MEPEPLEELDKVLLERAESSEKGTEEDERLTLLWADCVLLLAGLRGLVDTQPPAMLWRRTIPCIRNSCLAILTDPGKFYSSSSNVTQLKILRQVIDDITYTMGFIGLASSDECLELEEVLKGLIVLEQFKGETGKTSTKNRSTNNEKNTSTTTSIPQFNTELKGLVFSCCNCLIEMLTEKHRVLDSKLLTSGAQWGTTSATIEDTEHNGHNMTSKGDSLDNSISFFINTLGNSSYSSTFKISVALSFGKRSASTFIHFPLYALLRLLQINALHSSEQLERYREMFTRRMFLFERIIEIMFKNTSCSKQLMEIVDELIDAVNSPTLLVSRELIKTIAKVSVKMLSGNVERSSPSNNSKNSNESGQNEVIINCQGVASNCLIKLIPFCQQELNSSVFQTEEKEFGEESKEKEEEEEDIEEIKDEIKTEFKEKTRDNLEKNIVTQDNNDNSKDIWKCTTCGNIWKNGVWLKENGEKVCVLCRINSVLNSFLHESSNVDSKNIKRRNSKINESQKESDLSDKKNKRTQTFLHGFNDDSFVLLNALILSDYERMLNGSACICAFKAICIFNRNLRPSSDLLTKLFEANTVREFLSSVGYSHNDDASTAVSLGTEVQLNDTNNETEIGNAYAGRLEKILLACQPHILNVETLGGALLMLSVSKRLNLVNRAKVIRDLATLTPYLPKKQTVFCCVKGLLDSSVLVRDASLILAKKLVEEDLSTEGSDLRAVLLQSIFKLAVSTDNASTTSQLIEVVSNLIGHYFVNDSVILDFILKFIQIPRYSLIILSNALFSNSNNFSKCMENEKCSWFNIFVSFLHSLEEKQPDNSNESVQHKNISAIQACKFFHDTEERYDEIIENKQRTSLKTFLSVSEKIYKEVQDKAGSSCCDCDCDSTTKGGHYKSRSVSKKQLSPFYSIIFLVELISKYPNSFLNILTSLNMEFKELKMEELSRKKTLTRIKTLVNVAASLNTQIDIVLSIMKHGIDSEDKCIVSKLLPLLELYFSINDSSAGKCSQSQSLQQVPEQAGLNVEKDYQFIKKLDSDMLLALSEYVNKHFQDFDDFSVISFLKIVKIYLDFDQKCDSEASSKSSLTSDKLSKTQQSKKSKATAFKRLTFSDKNKLLHAVTPFLQNEHLLPHVIPVVAELNESFVADAIASYADVVIKDSQRVQGLWGDYRMKKYGCRLSSMVLLELHFSSSSNSTKEAPASEVTEVISDVAKLHKFLSRLDRYMHFISCAVRYSMPINRGVFLQKAEARTLLLDENDSNSLVDAVFGDSQSSCSLDMSTSMSASELNGSPTSATSAMSAMAAGTKLYLTTEMDVEYMGLLCYKCILIVQRVIEALLSLHNHTVTTIRLAAKLDQLHGHLLISYSNFAAVFPFLLTDIDMYVLPSEALELTLNAQQDSVDRDIRDILRENKASLTRVRPRLLALFNPRLYISLVHSTILSLSDVGSLNNSSDNSTEGEKENASKADTPEDTEDSKAQQDKAQGSSMLKATESLVLEVSKVLSPTKDEQDMNTTHGGEGESLRIQKIALLKALVNDNISSAMSSTYERFVSLDLDRLISSIVQVLKSTSGEKKSSCARQYQLQNSYMTASTSSAFLNLVNTVSSVGLVHPQQVLSMMLGLIGVSVVSNSITGHRDVDLSFLNTLVPSVVDLLSRYPAECIAVGPVARGLELMSLLAYKSVSEDVSYSVNTNNSVDTLSGQESPSDSTIASLIRSQQASFTQTRDIKNILESEKETEKIFRIPYAPAEHIYSMFGGFFKASDISQVSQAPGEDTETADTKSTAHKRQTHVSKKPQIVITAFTRALQVERHVELFSRTDESLREHLVKGFSATSSTGKSSVVSQSSSLHTPSVFFDINFKASLLVLFATQVATSTKYKEYISQSVERLWHTADSAACVNSSTPLSKLVSTILSVVSLYIKSLQVQQLTSLSPTLSPISSPRARVKLTRETETKQLSKTLYSVEQLCKLGCEYCMAVVDGAQDKKENLSLVIEHLYNSVVLKLKSVPSVKFFERVFSGDFSAVRKTKKVNTNRKAGRTRAETRADTRDDDDEIEDVTPPQRKRDAE